MKKELDVRGKACPQPVVETKALIEETWPEQLEVRVDSGAALENVSTLARSLGYEVDLVTGSCGAKQLLLTLTGEGGPFDGDDPAERPVPSGSTSCSGPGSALVLLTDTLGQGDADLGYKLMHGFLRTTLDSSPKPWRIVMLNHGVRLATVDDVTTDVLQLLQQAGVEVLVCGTCLEHLGLSDQLLAGRVTNMFEIVETFHAATKVVSIG